MYVLGFDPGGQKQFGWCFTEISQVEASLLVLDSEPQATPPAP